MKITKAEPKDYEAVMEIVHATIKTIYPNYYPQEVVDFFLEFHSEESIKKDIEREYVYLLTDGQHLVGTASLEGGYIGRVYVLPEQQGKGYGKALMNHLEHMVSVLHHISYVDASLPAYEFYLGLGYHPSEYHRFEVDNGRVLCYYVMEKELKPC